MKHPEFSEFTFGYALTDNLVNRVLTGVRGVPMFPSLKEEGQSGIGYDVKIPRNSTPLFLQFKLPQVVRRHRKIWDHNLRPTYYRMHLMRGSDSSQHRSLVRLAKRGKEVFYVAPEFHRRRDLSRFHSRGEVPLRSAFFDPEDIGKLSDEPHHIAYKAGIDTAWRCSEPHKLEKPCGSEFFLAWLRRAAHSADRIASADVFFDKLTDEIFHSVSVGDDDEDEEIEGKREEPPGQKSRISVARAAREAEIKEYRERLEPLRQRLGKRQFAGYAARLLLDCELLIVGHGENI